MYGGNIQNDWTDCKKNSFIDRISVHYRRIDINVLYFIFIELVLLIFIVFLGDSDGKKKQSLLPICLSCPAEESPVYFFLKID